MTLPARERLETSRAALERNDGNVCAAARELGISRSKMRRWLALDPAIADGMDAVGTNMVPRLVWAKTKSEDGTSYSVMMRPEDERFPSFLEHIRETIAETRMTLKLPKRFEARSGNLLVLDPADVHIGKLCVATETGYSYDSSIAEHRLYEGSRMLLERGAANGCTSALLVIGNDIAHIDTPHRKTTSGTPQDTDGSIFTIHRAAQAAYVRIVRLGLKMGLEMHVVFNPSNHDWVLGFTIAQVVRATFRDHPNVHVSDYAVSERHRKYLRFGDNLIGLTHGDGAKEADLGAIMLAEARPHMGEVRHLYWYVHHYHHKIRRALGVRSQAREKDHVGMTVIGGGAGAMEGDNVLVEYVRSPSPPDGWHDRNGYVNRQAVEAFIHHPRDGQVMRLTEWF